MNIGQSHHEPFTVQARHLAWVMAAVQCIWLAAIWATGNASHSEKLPLLLVYSLSCGIIACYPSAALTERFKGLEAMLQGREAAVMHRFLLVLLVICSVYAYLQLGWPDEKAIFAAARTISEQGLATFFDGYTEMPWLGKQHPPMVPLVYGFAMSIFGVHVVVPRLVSLILAMGMLYLTFAIARDLYGRRIALWTAAFLSSAPFFFRIGATGMSDMPMAFFFMLAVYLFLKLLRRPTYALALGTGLCIGVGLLCRYPMALIYPLLVICALVRRSFLRTLPYLAVVVLVSVILLAAWLGFAYHIGIIAAQAEKLSAHAGFTAHAASYSGYWRWYLVALFFRMPSGLGVANLPLLLIGVAAFVKRRSRSDVLILLWLAAIFLPLMLTLPGPRFFLPAFPALAIAMACGVDRLSGERLRVVLLSFLYAAGAMYLFVDWYQAVGLFFTR